MTATPSQNSYSDQFNRSIEIAGSDESFISLVAGELNFRSDPYAVPAYWTSARGIWSTTELIHSARGLPISPSADRTEAGNEGRAIPPRIPVIRSAVARTMELLLQGTESAHAGAHPAAPLHSANIGSSDWPRYETPEANIALEHGIAITASPRPTVDAAVHFLHASLKYEVHEKEANSSYSAALDAERLDLYSPADIMPDPNSLFTRLHFLRMESVSRLRIVLMDSSHMGPFADISSSRLETSGPGFIVAHPDNFDAIIDEAESNVETFVEEANIWLATEISLSFAVGIRESPTTTMREAALLIKILKRHDYFSAKLPDRAPQLHRLIEYGIVSLLAMEAPPCMYVQNSPLRTVTRFRTDDASLWMPFYHGVSD